MTYLIDSDVCIDVLQRRASSPFVEMTVAAGAAISIITYGEVLDGFLHSSHPAQNVSVWERFVAPFQIFDVTRDVAEIWAQIAATCDRAASASSTTICSSPRRPSHMT